MFTVYYYDQHSKAYTDFGPADPNPRSPGEPLIPFSSTTIEPPVFAAGTQMAFFRDYAWVVEDLPPAPPEPGAPSTPESIEPTFEERLKALQDVVQNQLDAIARAYGYDDIASAVTYAEEPAVPKFQQEGQALRAWRSLVWAACYELLGQVQRGERGEPTAAELVTALPVFVPPAPPEPEEPGAEQ